MFLSNPCLEKTFLIDYMQDFIVVIAKHFVSCQNFVTLLFVSCKVPNHQFINFE